MSVVPITVAVAMAVPASLVLASAATSPTTAICYATTSTTSPTSAISYATAAALPSPAIISARGRRRRGRARTATWVPAASIVLSQGRQPKLYPEILSGGRHERLDHL